MSNETKRGADQAFGVYIHWPFCAQKCPYCDFNSHVRHQGWDEDRFLSAYLRELDAVAEMIGSRTVTSIFFGGGTPSLMKPQTTAAILDHIAKLWTVDPNAEITLEANPGSVEAQRFKGYRAAGVNRVSMGIQSFRDDDLKRLGRIHTVDDAKTALKIAIKTFERYSFDLIYARPGQQPEAWLAELDEALDYANLHISLYQLTIEPDTPYAALAAAGKLIVPDQDAALALYEITQEVTSYHGLPPYEISNHARPGEESRHNLLYWRYGEYAGVGPGAHGRIVSGGKRLATVAEKNPEAWAALVEANGHGFTEMTDISPEEQADEMLLMGLRLREGIDLNRLAALGGVRPSTAALAHLQKLGMIETAHGGTFAANSGAAKSGTASSGRNWRHNELETIAMCAGPGLAPESHGLERLGHNAPPSLLRATPKGRFVLNAVVAELSKSFIPAA
jgi:putative oxygen-independent coproporphyrinogen III oxidase